MSLPLAIAVTTWLAIWWASRGRLLALVSLPATIAHELAHWSVALLTGGRPSSLRLWPRKEGNSMVLGEVTFTAHWLFTGAVALAPLWVLSPLAWWLVWGAFDDGALYPALRGIAAGYLFKGCIPSSQDWFLSLKYPIGTAVLIGILVLLVASNYQT